MLLKLKFNPNAWADFKAVHNGKIVVEFDPKFIEDERFEFEPGELRKEFGDLPQAKTPEWSPLEKAQIQRDAQREAKFRPRFD